MISAPSGVLVLGSERLEIPADLPSPVPGTGEVVLLLADSETSQSGWAARVAFELSRHWARSGSRVILADGDMAESDFTLDNVARDRIILGEPETCIREFHRWHEATGADYVLLRLRHAHSGGPAHESILSAIRRFGEGVIPYCE
jgi:alkanesulfonate monooxygenase SsuD/methylene tetrahydromethanopterin reductase-like flavin-dependent oxidoreductase (luciferase family)